MTIVGKYFSYFEISSKNTPHSKILISLFLLIEYFPIAILNFLSISQIRVFFRGQTFSVTKSILFKISLLKYFLPLISMKDPSHTSIQLILTLCLILILIILFIVSWIFQDESLTKHLELLNKSTKHSNSVQFMNYLKKLYHIILTWFYDICFFRIFSFWIIFALVNSAIVSDNLTHASFIEIIVRIFTLIIYCLTVILYFRYTFVYIKYQPNHKNYPYDEFSAQYEIIIFVNKIFIAIQFNTFLFNISSVLWMWAVCINTFSLCFYLLLLIYRLYKDPSFIIFYRNYKINILRIFYLVFYIINLIIHLIFNVNHNIAFVIVFYVCIISLSIILTIIIYNKQEAKVIEENDSIMKVFYIIDLYTTNKEKELQKFTKKLSISHMNKCSSDFIKCKICTIFKHIFVNQNVSNSNSYNVIGFGNDIKINVLELVDCLFTVNKKKLDPKSSRYMVISSFILLNTSRSNTYLLNLFYSKKIFFFIRHYPVLAINLMTYFKNIISSDMNSLSQVHAIIEQEHNKNKMKNFLELFKELLCGIEEKPEYVIQTSKKMHKIQISIKNNLISKYENSLDYQNIILKFMYEKILNTKIKTKGGTIFSFQLYDDLLQEHYSIDKFFLLSYDIPMKTFEITRTSREYCKYTSRSFESLFPFKNISKLHLEKLMSSVKENNLLKTTITNSLSRKSRIFPSTIVQTKNNQMLITQTPQTESPSVNQSVNNQNTNIFEFPIQDPQFHEYICSFKMNFKIFPTTDLKKFLTICFYQNKYLDTLITVYDLLLKEEKVISFSYNLKEYFLITPPVLSFLNKFNRNILFNDLFRLNSSENQEIEKGSIFETNYKKYLPIINNDLQFYFDTEISLSEEDKSNMINLIKKEQKYESENKKPKTLEFVGLNEFDSKTNHNVLLRVYYFKSKPKTRKNSKFEKEQSVNNELDLSISQNNFFSTFVEKKQNYKEVFSATPSITRGSSEKVSTLHGNIDILKQSLNGEKTKKNQHNKLSFFTCVILIYNLLLIVITIIFLILELSKNDEFQDSFSFYQSWNSFGRLFMHSTLSSFYLFCPAKDNLEKCETIFDKYDLMIKTSTNISANFNLTDYFQEELRHKLEKYQNELSQIKSQIFKTNQKNLISFGEKKILTYTFSESGGKSRIIQSYIPFFDDLGIFLNLLNSISTNTDFTNIPIQFVSKFDNGTLNIENVIINDNHSSKLDAYLILINYRLLLRALEEMTKIVTDNLLDNINACKFIGNFLSIFLIINHFGILCICIGCMVIFRSILKNHCIMITDKLNQEILIEALKEKVNILSTLILFYKENPNTLYDNYELLKSKTKTRMKLSDKDINDNSPTNSKTIEQLPDNNTNNESSTNSFEKTGSLNGCKESNNNTNINYSFSNFFQNTNVLSKRAFESAEFYPILRRSIKIIFIVFLCYFIYSIAYFILLITTLNNYSDLISTFSHNVNLDITIFSIATILPVMLFTNQTDLEMQTLYGITNAQEGYVQSTLKQCYKYLSLVEISENPHQTKITPLKKLVDLSCDNIFKLLKDDYLFIIMKDWYNKVVQNDTLEYSLGKLFCTFPSSKYKDDKMWIKDIIYRGIKLNSQVQHNIDTLYRLTNSQEIFEMYLLVLLIYRPLRHYESTYSFLDSVNSITYKYNIVIYTYLVINTFFEVILFYVLKMLVIEDYAFINQSLELMMTCMNV